MSRRRGDKGYANYVGYQSFSSDMPTHRINNTNWYLKFENNIPAFFINAEDVLLSEFTHFIPMQDPKLVAEHILEMSQ